MKLRAAQDNRNQQNGTDRPNSPQPCPLPSPPQTRQQQPRQQQNTPPVPPPPPPAEQQGATQRTQEEQQPVGNDDSQNNETINTYPTTHTLTHIVKMAKIVNKVRSITYNCLVMILDSAATKH
eukprot:8520787-Ditylum_brightwellii.AAC.1